MSEKPEHKQLIPLHRRLGAAVLRRLRRLVWSDRLYAQLEHYLRVGRWPDIDHPRTFNEKLLHSKLSPSQPAQYVRMADKATAKQYVRELTGSDELLVPTYGIYEKWEDIDWDALPEQFVLKTTHDSGTCCICRDRATFDREEARRKLTASLRRNFYSVHREQIYKEIPPRIIAEALLHDDEVGEARDYKFFCFDGEPRLMYVATGRSIQVCEDFFDMEGRHLPLRWEYPQAGVTPELPEQFGQMIEVARQLSQGIDQVRVDLYCVGGRIYFGEYTFVSGSGSQLWYPPEYDRLLGDMWRYNPSKK